MHIGSPFLFCAWRNLWLGSCAVNFTPCLFHIGGSPKGRQQGLPRSKKSATDAHQTGQELFVRSTQGLHGDLFCPCPNSRRMASANKCWCPRWQSWKAQGGRAWQVCRKGRGSNMNAVCKTCPPNWSQIERSKWSAANPTLESSSCGCESPPTRPCGFGPVQR